MNDLETWLENVYEAGGDRQTLDSLYNEWAQSYDQHLWSSGNPYIAIAAGIIGKHVRDYDAKILDVGCGTGNMAQILYQIGYNNMEGLDPSAGMLAIAERKGIYKKLHQLILDSEVDLPPASFDAIVAAGVLTQGHAPPSALDGIVSLTKSNGVVIFSLSKVAYEELGFGEKMTQLDIDGIWRQLDCSRLFRTYPFSEKEAHLRHWVYAYKKL